MLALSIPYITTDSHAAGSNPKKGPVTSIAAHYRALFMSEHKKNKEAIAMTTKVNFIQRYDVRLVRDGRVATELPVIIREPRDTIPILEAELGSKSAEVFLSLALNTKNHVIAILPVSSGSLNASIVHPRELFQRAILSNCASLIIAHNHPSGDPTPSSEDIQLTRRLVEAATILDIPILDHVILGYGKWMSFRERGLI